MDHLASALTLEPPLTAADLRVKVFADGADIEGIRSLLADPLITGFTTNPTLMRKAGVTNYESFAREFIEAVPDRPICFEVFADDAPEMGRQARRIASWGDQVFVKVPVTYTSGASTGDLLQELTGEGVKVNVTGITTVSQVDTVARCLNPVVGSFVSVFAGRIADTGIDPLPVMKAALELLAPLPFSELIWASPREILNVVQADQIGCHVITVTHDLLGKLGLLGRDLVEYSRDTVAMFHADARAAGYTL